MKNRPRGSSEPLVLVFGESLNDSRSIATLLAAANPSLRRRVSPRPRPVSLTREASGAARQSWVEQLRRAVSAYEATGQAVSVAVIHQDADGFDPDGLRERSLDESLDAWGRGKGVVPVQMLEARWFLFPDAVESIRPRAWKGTMPRRPRDVETISGPKEELRRRTRKGKGECYAEADSPAIAEKIAATTSGPLGVSRSFDRLQAFARSIT